MNSLRWLPTVLGILILGLVSSCENDDGGSGTGVVEQFSAVFQTEGTFAVSCDDSSPIEGYSRVVIFWDSDRNGINPDGDDVPYVQGDIVIEPDPDHILYANLFDFFVQAEEFESPVFQAWHNDYRNQYFYLRLYVGPNEEIQWTSPVFSLQAQYANPVPESIVLPALAWTCSDIVIEPPQCSSDPAYLVIDLANQNQDSFCVRTCHSSRTDMLFYSITDSIDDTRPPIVVLDTGCDGDESSAATFNPAAWWSSGSNSWQNRELVGNRYGHVNVRILDSVPCGDISEISVSRIDSTVDLTWTTSSEVGCTEFEIWIYHAQGGDWPHYVTTVPATRNPNGSTYHITDPESRPTFQYWYVVLMIDTNSVKYPARRVYLPREE